MDAHLHTYAIRGENARRIAHATRVHRLHADFLAPERPGLSRRVAARLHVLPLPVLAPAGTGPLVVAT